MSVRTAPAVRLHSPAGAALVLDAEFGTARSGCTARWPEAKTKQPEVDFVVVRINDPPTGGQIAVAMLQR
jgi:hypothetical protein